MDYRLFKEELYHILLEMPVATTVNATQVVVRCPFCGDSVRDFSHGHFYVKINIDDDNIPIMYNCFRCRTSGFMSSDVLRSLDIYDLEMCSTLTRYNKMTTQKLSKELGFKTGKLDYTTPVSKNTNNNKRKLEYMEERLGISFTYEELQELKVIVSFKDFLLHNNINELTCYENMAIKIENDYVGFLSLKNNFITFRDITGNHKERYIKYTIKKDLFNSGTFYAIPTDLDILTTDKIELHLAEGTFDTLGIFYHVSNSDKNNKVYVSVTGGDYVSPIKYFLNLGIVGDVDIHIYSDQDVKKGYYIKNIKNKFNIWVNDIYVHYNELSKDCGVPKEDISLLTYKL